MVELILQPEKNYVKGVLNYFFKDTYRSFEVKGDYDASNRRISLYNIPLTYFGSNSDFQIDCIMNLLATLRVAQAGSNLIGSFLVCLIIKTLALKWVSIFQRMLMQVKLTQC